MPYPKSSTFGPVNHFISRVCQLALEVANVPLEYSTEERERPQKPAMCVLFLQLFPLLQSFAGQMLQPRRCMKYPAARIFWCCTKRLALMSTSCWDPGLGCRTPG